MDQSYLCITRETIGCEPIDETPCRLLNTNSGQFCLFDGDENRNNVRRIIGTDSVFE